MKLDGLSGMTPFDLGLTPSMRREDFIASSSNCDAFTTVLGGDAWPEGRLVLVGPPKSGKTHLSGIWALQSDAAVFSASELDGMGLSKIVQLNHVVIDDAEKVAGVKSREVTLLHICNEISRRGRNLLVVCRKSPASWDLSLPDLESRLVAARLVRISVPDDDLLAKLLVKHLADRQVEIAPSVVRYILPRIERSYLATSALVDRLDRLSLAEGRPISRSMAAELLNTRHEDSEAKHG